MCLETSAVTGSGKPGRVPNPSEVFKNTSGLKTGLLRGFFLKNRVTFSGLDNLIKININAMNRFLIAFMTVKSGIAVLGILAS
jgi:hypothetical protein